MRTVLATAMLLCLTSPRAIGAKALRPEKLASVDTIVRDAIREGMIIGAALWGERVALRKPLKYEVMLPQIVEMAERGRASI